MKSLTLSAASRKSASGVSSVNSPRPSISEPAYASSQSFVSDNRITSVDEETADDNKYLLCTNDRSKDPRVCNERSDSGFSECSNCSTPSASCVCNQLASLNHDKNETIVEERSNNSSASSSSSHEPQDTTTSETVPNVDEEEEEEEVHTSSDHDIRSEISSLEYDTSNCDVAVSIRVPTRRELFQNELGEPMSEIERRKVSLENNAKKAASMRQEFSLEKLKKASKVAQLMEKFEETSPVVSPTAETNFKFKSSVTIETGLRCTNPAVVVKTCDLPKHSINAKHATNHKNISDSPPLSPSTVAKATAATAAATRTSPTNASTTLRLSNRVRETTERLSKPKQQAAMTTMTTDKTTKASILKQNANFVRSKEFWRR
jgi:hypothetical protein